VIIVSIVLAIAVYWTIRAALHDVDRTLLERSRDVVQVLAYVAALAYFCWKVRDGYFFVNLSVAIRLERTRHDEADWLVVTLILSKGDRSTLTLTDIGLTVFDDDREIPPAIRLDSLWIKEAKRYLRISPGETVALSAAYSVPRKSLCHVVASIHDRRRRTASFWKSTAISPPIAL